MKYLIAKNHENTVYLYYLYSEALTVNTRHESLKGPVKGRKSVQGQTCVNHQLVIISSYHSAVTLNIPAHLLHVLLDWLSISIICRMNVELSIKKD